MTRRLTTQVLTQSIERGSFSKSNQMRDTCRGSDTEFCQDRSFQYSTPPKKGPGRREARKLSLSPESPRASTDPFCEISNGLRHWPPAEGLDQQPSAPKIHLPTEGLEDLGSSSTDHCPSYYAKERAGIVVYAPNENEREPHLTKLMVKADSVSPRGCENQHNTGRTEMRAVLLDLKEVGGGTGFLFVEFYFYEAHCQVLGPRQVLELIPIIGHGQTEPRLRSTGPRDCEPEGSMALLGLEKRTDP